MTIPAGTYIIYNRVLSPAGEKLAISFNGNNQLATVKPLVDGDASQKVCSSTISFTQIALTTSVHSG